MLLSWINEISLMLWILIIIVKWVKSVNKQRIKVVKVMWIKNVNVKKSENVNVNVKKIKNENKMRNVNVSIKKKILMLILMMMIKN